MVEELESRLLDTRINLYSKQQQLIAVLSITKQQQLIELIKQQESDVRSLEKEIEVAQSEFIKAQQEWSEASKNRREEAGVTEDPQTGALYGSFGGGKGRKRKSHRRKSHKRKRTRRRR